MNIIFEQDEVNNIFNPDYDPAEDPEFDIEDMWIPAKEDLTCFKCPCRDECYWVDDLYNTDGDCLALK